MVEFLRKVYLFAGLSDEELAAAAGELQAVEFSTADVAFAEGDAASSMFFIYDGRVDLSRRAGNRMVRAGTLLRGDHFGQEGLLLKEKRDATATVDAGTVLLVLEREKALALLKKNRGLKQNLTTMLRSRQLAKQLKFGWLGDNEVINFLARKHVVLAVRDALVPFFLLIPISVLVGAAFLFNSSVIGLAGGFLFAADLGWGLWRLIDWGNDYYIVTNQRVIWLEKVIGFYDSRTEAGIGTILSVDSESDFLGRLFNYGTVIVRTYTGRIRMAYVDNPRQAAAMIEEYLNRAKELGRRSDQATMKMAIRAKLGLEGGGERTVVSAAVPAADANPKSARVKPANSIGGMWRNAFRMRTVEGNTITYHKHIFGFIRDASPYALGILVLAGLAVSWPYLMKDSFPTWMAMFVLLGVTVLFGVIGYQYLDWQNDIYQVTSEQIIDISRKPLGNEDRRAAPLENILSTEYKRNGIIGMLLNFGTVYIMVGDSHFDFDDVADPPAVQQDIISRQQGRLQKKRDTDTNAERERMTEWLAMYHRTMEEVKQEKEQNGNEKAG